MNRRHFLQRRLLRTPEKKPLQVISMKAPSLSDLSYRLILIEWNKVGETFLNSARITTQQSNLKIHIFFDKAEKDDEKIQSLRENLGNCVTLHESLTGTADGAWTDLLAYIINVYTKTLISCHHCSVIHPQPKYSITLVTSNEDRYVELVALLNSNKADTMIVDGLHTTILNIFKHVCHECRLIFPTRDEADKHDKLRHNFLCLNIFCERNNRENGFFTQEELDKHRSRQKACLFCSQLIYCDRSKYEQHMNEYHIFCNCSCQQYYRDKDDYLQHYCTLYPLPCLESTTCQKRFKNIDDQAFHHKTAHGSMYPYFCLACYGKSKLVCLHTSGELMTHVSEVNHNEADFQIVMIPE